MKTAAKQKRKQLPTFEQGYRAALLAYTKNRGEAALGQAYELGRRGLSEGKSLLEIASIHHQTLGEMALAEKENGRAAELFGLGAAFIAESLSPYEMAQRGFHDAVNSLRRLNETLEEEIKRMAHAVHDDAGQLLVAVHLALADLTPGLPEPHSTQVLKIEELLKQVESELRRYSHELRPTILDDLGWLPAVRFLADSVSKRTGIRVEIASEFGARLNSSLETALYRIVQEALHNAAKHAKASNVRIKVARQRHQLSLSIYDDGVGFNPQALPANPYKKGLGLLGIKERLNALGGTLTIESGRGKGTTLLIRFPLEKKNAYSHSSR